MAPGRLGLVAVHGWDVHGVRLAGLLTGWASRLEGTFPAAFDPPDVEGPDLVAVVDAWWSSMRPVERWPGQPGRAVPQSSCRSWNAPAVRPGSPWMVLEDGRRRVAGPHAANVPSRRARLLPVLVVVALLAGACSDGSPGAAGDLPPDDGVRSVASVGQEDAELADPVPQVPGTPPEGVVSALDDPDDPRLGAPLIDTAELVPGGPPPDGIPSIDEPTFLAPDDAGFLDDREPVLALRIGDDARAYPVQILMWHEIVNDTVGGVPVAVSYCPLCNSAVAYDRRLGDRVLDFGTSGQLYQSALVMYDRQTESLWSHFTGRAVVGALVGAELTLFPLSTVSWAEWRGANPGGLVLSRDTGHQRAYGQNPYPGYDDVGTSPYFFEDEVDGRLAAKTRVVGLRDGGDAVAVVLDELLERAVVEVELDGRRLVVWAVPGTTSALDATSVAGGRDVGATGAFVPRVDGRDLSFVASGDGFEDRETGSRWNVLGEAEDGPLAGEVLQLVEHVDTFWFAWAAFLPGTRLAP